MSLNEAMKIGEWSIHDPEKKKLMGFSQVSHGIFLKLQLVVLLVPVLYLMFNNMT